MLKSYGDGRRLFLVAEDLLIAMLAAVWDYDIIDQVTCLSSLATHHAILDRLFSM